MHLGFGPCEGAGGAVVGFDKSIDVVPELSDAGEARAAEGLPAEDREPALDLVEPGGMGRREVEMNILVAGQPNIAGRLMGTEIVEDDVDLPCRAGSHDAVHEIEELDAPPALVVACHDLAAGDVEGGEQGRGAVARVMVRLPGECPPIGQLQVALSAFEGLDVRLLVDL